MSSTQLPPTRGKQVIRWIENCLVHGEGSSYGEPFKLRPDEKLFLLEWYEHDDRGRWLWHTGYLQCPKGWGKTEFGAAIGLVEFAGPVARGTPNIPVAAASYEQADLLFGRARQMCTHDGSPLAPHIDGYDTELRFADGRPGKFYRVAAEAGSNDGTLPSLFLADEIHEWTGRRARVHLVISNSLTKRTPPGRNLNFSTPGAYDTIDDTPAGRLHRKGLLVQSGEIEPNGYLFRWIHAADDHDLTDPADLKAAVLEANPHATPERVDALISRYSEIPEHEYRRYHLAQWVQTTERWLPAGVWEALEVVDPPAPGDEVVLAFDGSYSNDSTALVGCTLDTPTLFVIDVWERPEHARDGWVVPREEVHAAVHDAMDTYQVRSLACDPPGWHREIDEWHATWGDVVLHWPTNVRKRMAEACSRFYTAVGTGELRHDGSPVLTRHLENCTTKNTPQGTVVVKDTHTRKIDAAVAAIVAFSEATTIGEQTPAPVPTISFV